MSLKLQHAHKSPGELAEMQFLILKVWGGAGDSAFLTSSQMTPVLLALEPHFSSQYSTILHWTNICSFIQPCNKYLLSTYIIPDNVLSASDTKLKTTTNKQQNIELTF